jgi:hypothetical protein
MDAFSHLDGIPLWALYFLTIAVVLLSIELGWRLGNYQQLQTSYVKKTPTGTVLGSIFGLLAFLLAFTFGMAATRYDNRKQIVLQEANAIGTTYLRTDFLSGERSDEARNILRKYAALRSGGSKAIMSPNGMALAGSMHNQLWTIAADATEADNTVKTGLFVQSLNEMIDLDEIRQTALRNRIPDSIWFMFSVVTIFSMLALGYEFGLSGARNWVIIILLTIVFSTVIFLIIDLDRPQTGLVQVSQQPLLDVIRNIGTPTP